MPGKGVWASPKDQIRKRVRLSGVTVDRSTLKALRWRAVRSKKSLGVLLEELVRPGLGLAPLDAPPAPPPPSPKKAAKKPEDVGKSKKR